MLINFTLVPSCSDLYYTVLRAWCMFQGFSSCLSGRTSPDPSRSVLPAGAVIKSIDRIKGPFDPSNTEYIQEGLTWEAFKTTLLTS